MLKIYGAICAQQQYSIMKYTRSLPYIICKNGFPHKQLPRLQIVIARLGFSNMMPFRNYPCSNNNLLLLVVPIEQSLWNAYENVS